MELWFCKMPYVSVLVNVGENQIMLSGRQERNGEAVDPTGLQYPHQFFFRGKSIWNMLENFSGDNDVECLVSK